MSVELFGFDELQADLAEMAERIEETESIAEELAECMREYVPVRTGHLRSTIYHRSDEAGATAPYAAIVAERGRDYVLQSIQAFNVEQHADYILEPI